MHYEKNSFSDYLPRKWDSAIRVLGRDFCVPPVTINNIISTVVEMGINDNSVCYNRAWQMLFDVL